MANIGSTDKIIRLVAGVALIALAFLRLGLFSTTLGFVVVVVGVVLIATAVINFCPVYKLLGMRTNRVENG